MKVVQLKRFTFILEAAKNSALVTYRIDENFSIVISIYREIVKINICTTPEYDEQMST